MDKKYLILYMSITLLESACVAQPCKNGGVCKPDMNSYVCECSDGYTGKTCTGRHYNHRIK